MKKFGTEGPGIHTLFADFLPSQVSRDVTWTDQYWKLVFDILSRSSRTLEKVTMDGNSAFKLKNIAERMQPLANVASLTFSIHENSRRSGISEFLLPVDQIFPRVTTVWIQRRRKLL